MIIRRRNGEYSALKVMQVGIAPPRPIPVRKRKAVRLSMEWAQAEARVPRLKISTDTSNTFLRPYLSAIGPNRKAPHIRPNRPAPKAGDSWLGCRPHSWRSEERRVGKECRSRWS